MEDTKLKVTGTLNEAFKDDEDRVETVTELVDIELDERECNNSSPSPTNCDEADTRSNISRTNEIDQDKAEEREKWSNPVEFLLSCISLSVGLGNVWRFPSTAIENGGGAFLIPYLIVLLFIGRPLYYMELCLGQFVSYGCVKIWNMAPGFKGIGIGQMAANSMVCIYYVSIMAVTLYYFISSFSKALPWELCPANMDECFDSQSNASSIDVSNMMSSAEYFFVKNVTHKYELGLDHGIDLPLKSLSLCSFFSWAIVFLTLVKGVQSSGKVAYFTALFPYLALIILLIRAATLPGAVKGLKYFVTPQFDKLLEPKVWVAAIGQCFFSLSVGYGSIMMMSSYNGLRHNVFRDATIISMTDTLTSILSGCTTFAIMGYFAEQMGVEDIRDVIKGGGSAIAFISYPNVLARFGWATQLFSVVFFLMLLSLGVGSAVGLSNAVITALSDSLPQIAKWKVTLAVCITGFLVGQIYVTPQGPFALRLVDFYTGEIAIILLTILEVIAVHWVYGMKNFTRDIEFMLKRKTGYYWKACWGCITPLGLIFIVIFNFVTWKDLSEGDYVFGFKANIFGALLTTICVGIVPAYFVGSLLATRKKSSSYKSALTTITTPSPSWGPMNKHYKALYEQVVRSTQNLSGNDIRELQNSVTGVSFNHNGGNNSNVR